MPTAASLQAWLPLTPTASICQQLPGVGRPDLLPFLGMGGQTYYPFPEVGEPDLLPFLGVGEPDLLPIPRGGGTRPAPIPRSGGPDLLSFLGVGARPAPILPGVGTVALRVPKPHSQDRRQAWGPHQPDPRVDMPKSMPSAK